MIAPSRAASTAPVAVVIARSLQRSARLPCRDGARRGKVDPGSVAVLQRQAGGDGQAALIERAVDVLGAVLHAVEVERVADGVGELVHALLERRARSRDQLGFALELLER